MAFDGEDLVVLQVLLCLGELRGKKDVHLFGQKSVLDVKLTEFFDLSCRNADLFFKLADRAGFRVFAVFERSGGKLKKMFPGGVAILPYECNSSIIKYRQDYRAPAMHDDLALVFDIVLADLIHTN